MSDDPANPNAQKVRGRPFQAGQVANPAGRPKGSRNKLGEAFVADLYQAWQARGAEVIQRVMDERPQDALKVIASLLPKQVEIKEDAFGELTDEQLAAIVSAARSHIAVHSEGRGGADEAALSQPPGGLPPLH